jgi:diadenosine tetraphosphate (Ap4A) HIT family hydrolase
VNPTCEGCQKAIDPGRSVPLKGGSSLGHYGGEEGFFGWLALQTIEHRYTLRDLSQGEADALGVVLRDLERGIYNYWQSRDRPVDRVYVMYFLESQLEPEHKWHLHFHLVPRFKSLDPSMRDKIDVLCKKVPGIDAYLISKLRPDHPTYRLPSFLDRDAFKSRKAELKAEELKIVNGVASATVLQS